MEVKDIKNKELREKALYYQRIHWEGDDDWDGRLITAFKWDKTEEGSLFWGKLDRGQITEYE